MSANKFFEQFSIEEISKRTKISPISLRFIKNKEYEKIPKVKFLGFIKIIEREFHVNLSDLIEEYNQVNHTEKVKEKTIIQEEKVPPKKEKNYIIFILGIVLLVISGILLYKIYTKKENNSINNKITTNLKELNNSIELKNTSNNLTLQNNTKTNINKENLTDKNISQIITTQTPQVIANQIEKNITKNTVKENNLTKEKKVISNQITIIPQKLVWYRIKNLDTNKTSEFLTSKTKTFKGKNFFIKFGHGEVTIKYSNQTITPNTKKIVRILIKNGKYQFIQKGETR